MQKSISENRSWRFPWSLAVVKNRHMQKTKYSKTSLCSVECGNVLKTWPVRLELERYFLGKGLVIPSKTRNVHIRRILNNHFMTRQVWSSCKYFISLSWFIPYKYRGCFSSKLSKHGYQWFLNSTAWWFVGNHSIKEPIYQLRVFTFAWIFSISWFVTSSLMIWCFTSAKYRHPRTSRDHYWSDGV